MSKPSEKAMQLALDIERAALKATWGNGKQEIAKLIDTHNAAELEAQHRKTWALVMEEASSAVHSSFSLAQAAVKVDELSCPPIEATKDK